MLQVPVPAWFVVMSSPEIRLKCEGTKNAVYTELIHSTINY